MACPQNAVGSKGFRFSSRTPDMYLNSYASLGLEHNNLSRMNTYTNHTQANVRFDSAEANQNLKSKWCLITRWSVEQCEYKIQNKNHKRKQSNGCLHGKPWIYCRLIWNSKLSIHVTQLNLYVLLSLTAHSSLLAIDLLISLPEYKN